MADRRRNHSGPSSDRPSSAHLISGNGVNEGKGKSIQELSLQCGSTGTISTCAEDGANKDEKKVAWETMLPSKRTNTIGNSQWKHKFNISSNANVHNLNCSYNSCLM